MLEQGAATLHATALELHKDGQVGRGEDVLMIEAGGVEEEAGEDGNVGDVMKDKNEL